MNTDSFYPTIVFWGFCWIYDRKQIHFSRDHWRLYWDPDPGHILIRDSANIFPMNPGMVYLIAPYAMVDQELEQPVRTLYVHFSLGFPYDKMASECIKIIPKTEVIHLLQQQIIHYYLEVKDRCQLENLLKAYIHAVLSHFSTSFWINLPNYPLPFLELLQFLRHSPHKNYTVDELTCMAGVSRSTLFYWFNHYLQMSPHQWLIKRRLEQVAQDLLLSRDSLQSLALRYGFCHAKHLAYHFRRHYGISPSDYRQRYGI